MKVKFTKFILGLFTLSYLAFLFVPNIGIYYNHNYINSTILGSFFSYKLGGIVLPGIAFPVALILNQIVYFIEKKQKYSPLITVWGLLCISGGIILTFVPENFCYNILQYIIPFLYFFSCISIMVINFSYRKKEKH